MDVTRLREKLAELEAQQRKLEADFHAVDGAQQILKQLIAEETMPDLGAGGTSVPELVIPKE